MISECARATTAEEARFRIDYPNSAPRRITIIALDAPAERVVRQLANGKWNSANFMTAASNSESAAADWLSDLAGRTSSLLDQLSAADHVVTVSIAGERSDGAAIIAEVCSAQRIMLTALVIDPMNVPEPQLLRTMAPLRVHASMLVVAKGEEYIEAMLTALRA